MIGADVERGAGAEDGRRANYGKTVGRNLWSGDFMLRIKIFGRYHFAFSECNEFCSGTLAPGVIYSVDFSFVYNVINCSEMKGFLNFYA